MPRRWGWVRSGSTPSSAAALRTAWTVHHDTANAAATSETDRPVTTALRSRSRSLAVVLARAGTCPLTSANVRLGQRRSTQANRRLIKTTRTWPATGTARSRCRVR